MLVTRRAPAEGTPCAGAPYTAAAVSTRANPLSSRCRRNQTRTKKPDRSIPATDIDRLAVLLSVQASADRGMGRDYRQALLCCWTFPPTIGPAVLVTLSRVNMN